MKTRRLSTILTSAYLSAMLASSVAPVRSDATLAATFDPAAAQKALQSAVSGLDAGGWITASTTATQASPMVAAKLAPQNAPPKAEPAITELIARALILARGTTLVSTLDGKTCRALGLSDGSKDMEMRMLESDIKQHYFAIPITPGSKDVLIIAKVGTTITTYLTDKTGVLRAVSVSTPTEAHLILNESAAAGFKAEMAQLAKEAAKLPPSGTAVAGNS